MPASETSRDGLAELQATLVPSTTKFRYAVKTALSLVLAYLIPMGMGWPQPQTAAITVMLVAATGMASDSLQKGVMRVLGTLAGGVIGLTLIALFPQDRMAYLFAASVAVSIIAYLYNAYQGDSTLFMLTAMVTLMVFNGGDAEGAFIYGVDRAFMTAFGVLVYTVVATILWPVRAVDRSRDLAARVAGGYHRAFALLVQPAAEDADWGDEQLAALLAREETFETHFQAVQRHAEGVAAYLAEWNCVVWCHEQLQGLLLPALRQESRHGVDFGRYLDNYDEVVAQVEALFTQIDAKWRGQPSSGQIRAIPVQYRPHSLREAPHLTVGAVASRAELLDKIQAILLELDSALDSMLFDSGNFVAGRKPRRKPAFIWRDLENAKTALRMFLTFWMATAVWITVNPPIGFTFVALCSVLVLMVSYTPVTPKLLIILFSMGFLFALPAYVFLLPQLSHWLELAVFMFSYAFIGFYVFQGPVALFFLLGLFALGIQNTMSYNFDVMLLIVLTLYLMCALLIITTLFPFTSKPERLYASLNRRFFHSCAHMLALAGDFDARPRRLPADYGASLLAKLHAWGGRIDCSYFPADTGAKVTRLNRACELLHGQIQVLLMRREEFARNRLVMAHSSPSGKGLLVELCNALAQQPGGPDNRVFAGLETRLLDVGARLDELRQSQQIQDYERAELALFFVYLNLQASILVSIRSCREARQAVDWEKLAWSRF